VDAPTGDLTDRGRVLIVVENLPAPFDRRVWQEATALRDAGCQVTIICPQKKGYEQPRETVAGITILRHPSPVEARGPLGYALEYGNALLWELWLSWSVHRTSGFDVVHACNPPDTVFVLGRVHRRLSGARFVFDHHDLSPELFESKFRRRGVLWRLLSRLERSTFRTAGRVDRHERIVSRSCDQPRRHGPFACLRRAHGTRPRPRLSASS